MNANDLERLMRSDGGVPGREWPPLSEAARWERVRRHRLRLENDAAALWMYASHLHVREDPDATAKRYRDFTPVPIGRDIARLSSQLLFAEPPKLTVEGEIETAALDGWQRLNGLHEFLSDAGDHVAATGEVGLRIIRDDKVSSRFPLVSFEGAERCIWAELHGRFNAGGVVVVEVDGDGSDRFRLLEHHGVGFVKRALFKGDTARLGTRVPLDRRPEFSDLRDEEKTGLNVPTLVRWRNVPGSKSDLDGIEGLLEAADEAESVFRTKSRASRPLTFAHRRLAEQDGSVDLDGVVLMGENQVSPVEGPDALAQVVQGRMESQDHELYVKHVREMAITGAGYSIASWGLDHGGGAESGRALKLRQSRTLLTRSGKERMASEAIEQAAGISLALMSGRADIPAVEVKLGDGLPVDRYELAQELAELKAAGAISTETMVRELHADWDEKMVMDEVGRIEAADARPDPVRDLLRGVG